MSVSHAVGPWNSAPVEWYIESLISGPLFQFSRPIHPGWLRCRFRSSGHIRRPLLPSQCCWLKVLACVAEAKRTVRVATFPVFFQTVSKSSRPSPLKSPTLHLASSSPTFAKTGASPTRIAYMKNRAANDARSSTTRLAFGHRLLVPSSSISCPVLQVGSGGPPTVGNCPRRQSRCESRASANSDPPYARLSRSASLLVTAMADCRGGSVHERHRAEEHRGADCGGLTAVGADDVGSGDVGDT